jgi:hypothetical protein
MQPIWSRWRNHGKNRRENPAGGLFGSLQKLSNALFLLVIFRAPGGMKLA